jgi:beta-glucosidase
VDIKNVGKMAGAEVAQLYVGDSDCREACPVRELKAFDKIMLQPGELRTLSFVLTPRDFSHYDVHANEWRVDEGEFEIAVGSSSRDLRLHSPITVTEE